MIGGAGLLPDAIPTTISENDLFPKIATCIPVIGAIVGGIAQYSIAKRLQGIRMDQLCRIANTIFLIEVKNHYKIASVVRDVVVLAILVAQLAAGLFTGMYVTFGVLAGVCVFLIGKSIYEIYRNQQNINHLQNNRALLHRVY